MSIFFFLVELKTIQVYKSSIYIYISKAKRKSNYILNWNSIKV